MSGKYKIKDFSKNTQKTYESLADSAAHREHATYRHMEALLHVAKKHGYDGRADPETLNQFKQEHFKTPEDRLKMVDDLADFYAAKGMRDTLKAVGQEESDLEKSLEKVKEVKDSNPTLYDQFMSAHANTTYQELKQTAKEYGEEFISQFTQRNIPSYANQSSQRVTQGYASRLEQKDVPEIMIKTGASQFFDSDNVTLQDAITILAHYAETGEISEEWARKQSFYLNKKKNEESKDE